MKQEPLTALDWIITLRHGNLSVTQIQEWSEWIASPENQSAFEDAQRIWEMMDGVQPPQVPRSRIKRYVRTTFLRKSPERRYAWLGLAALIGTIAIVGWTRMTLNTEEQHASGVGEYATQAAQHRSFKLEDGSTIHLGGHSAVNAQFDNHVRFIVMGSGEAIFEVAHDAKRPWRVYASGGVITAVGTAFNVRTRDNQVTVAVSEGAVIVAPAVEQTARTGGDLRHGRRIASGESISYTADGTLSDVVLVDPARSMGWRTGRLEYRSEPLSRVVQDVNRYSQKSIVLADEKAGAILYTGTVLEMRVDDWLFALETAFPQLEVTRPDSRHVIIRSRSVPALTLR